MKIDETILNRLAQKVALNLLPEQRNTLCKELNVLTQWTECLSQLDTTAIEPQITMSVNTEVFADNKSTPPMTPKEALANAPEHDHAYFHVPSVSKKQ